MKVQKDSNLCNNVNRPVQQVASSSSRQSTNNNISPIVYHLANGASNSNLTNQSNSSTPNSSANNSWPFILSPVPSLLANVPQNQLVNQNRVNVLQPLHKLHQSQLQLLLHQKL